MECGGSTPLWILGVPDAAGRGIQSGVEPPHSKVAMFPWRIRDRELTFPRPLVMGIVNVTPDSFSDGGKFTERDAALRHASQLIDEGADLLDIGGESTRPGSQPVSVDEELRRVAPVIEALAKQYSVPLSVDTSKAAVARHAVAAGAHIINDVTALTGDPDMIAVARDTGAGVILMHMQGTPATMQLDPHYDDVSAEIAAYLNQRLRELVAQGLSFDNLAVDPGIGFGKRFGHNLEMLVRMHELVRLGRPICLGVSRKGFLGKITGRTEPRQLAAATAAVSCWATLHQTAHILRVHDVAATRDAVLVIQAFSDLKEKLLV
jgi:dihydropteroate synthase